MTRLSRMSSVTPNSSPPGEFEAGSHQTFTLTYTCGYFGIDDSGSLRVVFRFAADQTRPQFDDPKGPNFTTDHREQQRGARVSATIPKGNIRPWDRTLYIKVVRGFMKKGDTITITFGDTSQGSPGMRLQTFCEDTFEFRMLVDPIATYNYQQLPEPAHDQADTRNGGSMGGCLPHVTRKVGDSFRLSIKAEDKWGNPTNQAGQTLTLRASRPVNGLPEQIQYPGWGEYACHVEGLSVDEAGDVDIELLDDIGRRAVPRQCTSHTSSRPICCPTGATCTARARRPSAPTARATTLSSPAIVPSSTSPAIRATTSRLPRTSGTR